MALHIVTGPPAAGKSTFVRERATVGDIRVDYDELANVLTGRDAANHDHPSEVRPIVQAVRRAAIDAALAKSGELDVWIIHSAPSAKQLDRYREHGAVVHIIDPGRQVVMHRIKSLRPKQMHAIAARWYEQQESLSAPRPRSTTERGLGWRHQKQRERLLRAHRDGTPCWWCGDPMYRSQKLDADHEQARAHGGKLAERLLHSGCNRSRKDGARDDQRPALAARGERAGPARVFDWGG